MNAIVLTSHSQVMISMFWLVLCSSSHAQETRILEVIGEGYPKEQAKENARSEALRQSGVRLLTAFSEIQTGSKADAPVSRQIYTSAISLGLIAEETEIECKLHIRGEPPNEFPIYVVKLQVKIKNAAPADPYFQLEMKLNPAVSSFRDGEKAWLELTASKDCYVTVFSVGADNNLWLVFPNLTETRYRLTSHGTLKVDNLVMRLLPNMDKASEHLIAIATKEDFPFVDLKDQKKWQVDRNSIAFSLAGAATKLAEWLGRLGEDQWTLARVPYSIIK